MDQGGKSVRYVLQRINHNIFRNPDGLMRNVERVCRHTQAKLAQVGRADASRRALTLVPTRDGRGWYVDPHGNHWRCYVFVERATGHDVIRNADQAFQAAKAFGAFQALLADLPGDRLIETIPNFHHTPSRYAAFAAALAKDAHGRAKEAAPEIAFAQARAHEVGTIVEAMARGEIPERVTHNDTKLNNVLLDNESQEGICVIDLDTVMPGSALYDFGDLVRTSTSPAAEDETDLSKVTMQLPMFAALVQGYLASAGGFLTPRERELLPFAGKLITFEIGLRFLTDWLEGDVYFKVKRPRHNLDRLRTQFKLVESIEAQLPAMQALVR
jgi:Ser/Thr protein kinase RdoA (MazF antagonist)